MADFRQTTGLNGSPSRIAINEHFCGLGDGKLADLTHASPASPAIVGKLRIRHLIYAEFVA